jgi:hypothetical protein
MGNKQNNSKPLSKNQASHALASGVNGGYGGNLGQALSVIRIPLIQINLPLISQISIGDNVSVRWRETAFYCFFKNTQLGKIPSNYKSRFVQSHSYRGSIFSFKEQPPSVTIEISL